VFAHKRAIFLARGWDLLLHHHERLVDFHLQALKLHFKALNSLSKLRITARVVLLNGSVRHLLLLRHFNTFHLSHNQTFKLLLDFFLNHRFLVSQRCSYINWHVVAYGFYTPFFHFFFNLPYNISLPVLFQTLLNCFLNLSISVILWFRFNYRCCVEFVPDCINLFLVSFNHNVVFSNLFLELSFHSVPVVCADLFFHRDLQLLDNINHFTLPKLH